MIIDLATEYAIIALEQLAVSPGRSVKISQLARQTRVSESYLRKVLQRLQRTGIVKMVRGPQGGVAIGRGPKRVSLAEIFRAVQGDSLHRCGKFAPPWCQGESCRLKKILHESERGLMRLLAEHKLSELTAS